MSLAAYDDVVVDDFLLLAAQASMMSLLDVMEESSVWVKDAKHCYHFANRGFLLNYGIENESDVLGKTDFELSEETIAAQFRHDDELVLGGQVIRDRMEVVGRFDHVPVWCLTTKIPIRNQHGHIIGTAGMCRSVPTEIAAPRSDEAKPLAKVIEFMRENIARPCDNHELAEICHLSTRAFERKFRGVYFATPQSYLRQLRIRMACQQLMSSNRTLADIATSFGYCDQSHFGRDFLRETGLAPSAYRKRFLGQETQRVTRKR